MLPDGLSDVELTQSKLPINNILGCKAALICTTLAYSDEHQRLKVLVPIREYMQKIQPPGDHLVQPLLKYFQQLLEFFTDYDGTQSSSATVTRISSNYSNIQTVLWKRLQPGHHDLANSIYCICDLNRFSRLIGRGTIPLMRQIQLVLLDPHDHRLKAYYIMELFNSKDQGSLSNPETLASKALEHFNKFDDLSLKCMHAFSLL
jgi:hypothetical protein